VTGESGLLQRVLANWHGQVAPLPALECEITRLESTVPTSIWPPCRLLPGSILPTFCSHDLDPTQSPRHNLLILPVGLAGQSTH